MRFGGIPLRSCPLFSECVFWWVVVSDWLSGLYGLVGRLGLVCALGNGDYARVHRRLVRGWVFVGVGVIRNPRERGARPGVLVTVNAAACYSPTSSRVQYHRRARP